jgi:hypothetical protein
MLSNMQILQYAGLSTLLSLIFLFFSCRCMGGHKVLEKLFKNRNFMKLYKLHCWFWAWFFVSIVIHITMAKLIFGF